MNKKRKEIMDEAKKKGINIKIERGYKFDDGELEFYIKKAEEGGKKNISFYKDKNTSTPCFSVYIH